MEREENKSVADDNKIETFEIGNEKKFDNEDYLLIGFNLLFGGKQPAICLVWKKQSEVYKFMKKVMPDKNE